MRFVHDELDDTKDLIRLMRIERDTNDNLRYIIKTFDRPTCPAYQALSYAWGSAEDAGEILLSGGTYSISYNLWSFLQHFSDPNTGIYCDKGSMLAQIDWQLWLWIDQICIDQSSVSEKNHQVGKMASIYQNAERVIVWLGPASEHSEAALRALSSRADSACTASKVLTAHWTKPSPGPWYGSSLD